jgi:hypothetical protein
MMYGPFCGYPTFSLLIAPPQHTDFVAPKMAVFDTATFYFGF